MSIGWSPTTEAYEGCGPTGWSNVNGGGKSGAPLINE